MRKNTQFAWVAGGAAAALAAALWRRRRIVDFYGASVVIVGGSRGLGLVAARLLASEGARLTLVARDADELDRAQLDLERYGAPVAAAACDIRDRAQVERTIAGIARDRGGIDVLINDAGIIQVGPLEHMTVEDFENALATHFWGPLYTTLAALPHLRQSPIARIVNISSIGGKIAVPHLLPYCASKFALTGLSSGLRAELAKDGILVTTVCPGLMRTGSTYNAWFKGDHRSEFTWFHLSASMPGMSIDAERAARRIIEACRQGRAELVLTLPAKAAVLLNAVCPGATAAMLALTNRVLPGPAADAGSDSKSGWQSVSRAAPSFASRLTDRASVENNEVPAGAPPLQA
jgi:NAD(P)-dependent dehydrogenase (short-subunit alcohol dehydrogenase family)